MNSRDFPSYSGKFLEKFFIEKLKLSHKYTNIGNYWESRHKNEIDIIGINEEEKFIELFDIKLNPEKLSTDSLRAKSQKISSMFRDYRIEYKGLSINDM